MTVNLRILSLGAGVQSSTIALMMAAGEIPCADVAIFADTKAEPAATYEHLEWLERQLPFEVVRVSAGDLGAQIIAASEGRSRNDARPPFYVKNPDGSRGILRRQCTGDYKIDPIHANVRALLGVAKGRRVPTDRACTQVIGISHDEAGRMKASRHAWQTNEYPLVDRRLTRGHCIEWLQERSLPVPPKSACVFCPFRRDAEWLSMKTNAPDDFAAAVRVDEAIRAPGYGRLVGECYVHGSMQPLAEIDFATLANSFQLNLWEDECDGVCGV